MMSSKNVLLRGKAVRLTVARLDIMRLARGAAFTSTEGRHELIARTNVGLGDLLRVRTTARSWRRSSAPAPPMSSASSAGACSAAFGKTTAAHAERGQPGHRSWCFEDEEM
jgi:hypothetical protein